MVRLLMICSAMIFLVHSVAAFPLATIPGARGPEAEPLTVHLTKSNACKPKYKHKKAAQALREQAHCK